MCNCANNIKVPDCQKDFSADQRSNRFLKIKKTTPSSLLYKTNEIGHFNGYDDDNSNTDNDDEDNDDDDTDDDNNDADYEYEVKNEIKHQQRKILKCYHNLDKPIQKSNYYQLLNHRFYLNSYS